MNRLSILGAGGHGKVVADAAEVCGHWDEIVFYDDAWPQKKECGPWRIVGSVQSFLKTSPADGDVVIAIGNNAVRANIVSIVRDAGFTLTSIIHPAAVVSKYANIGAGTVIFAGAIVNAEANIGLSCIINTGATVDHECRLGQAVHICPGAHLSGTVSIGDKSWIGVGACVRQGITIGSNVMVGAGAVVVSLLPNNVTAVGNPAKLIREFSYEVQPELVAVL